MVKKRLNFKGLRRSKRFRKKTHLLKNLDSVSSMSAYGDNGIGSRFEGRRRSRRVSNLSLNFKRKKFLLEGERRSSLLLRQLLSSCFLNGWILKITGKLLKLKKERRKLKLIPLPKLD